MKQDIQVQQSDAYQSQDDVVIAITTTTPQPDITSIQNYTVGNLNQQISDLNDQITALQTQQANLQSILDTATPQLATVQLKVATPAQQIND